MLMEGLNSVGILHLIEWLAMASIPSRDKEFFSLVTSATGVLGAPEAVERSQRIFSWIQNNESCTKA